MKTKKESLDVKYARFVAYKDDIKLPLMRSFRPQNDVWAMQECKNDAVDGGVFLKAE
jgi:hypothetical protein